LKALAGTYFSEEINAYYKYSFKDGKLRLSINDKAIGTLDPIMKDLFKNDEIGLFEIDSNEKGEPRGFSLNAGRVRNLKFVKQ